MIRPTLLYVSPVIPSLQGNGLAMRAGAVLRALSQHYDVSLLVVPLYPPFTVDVPVQIVEVCAGTVVTVPENPAPERGIRRWIDRVTKRPKKGVTSLADRAGEAFPDTSFDVVHVFRLATLAYARKYLTRTPTPRRHLDMDDIESVTHRAIAALARSNGHILMADFEEDQAQQYDALQTAIRGDFDRIYVCSMVDKQQIGSRMTGDVYVVPNAVPVQPVPPSPSVDDPYTFLFVGTLGYYPNDDAVRHFCRQILPLLRERTTRSVRFAIVGAGASLSLAAFGSLPDIQFVGNVEDVAPWYHAANAVVVPLRAGGGTRIKVIEAMSYWRPVVSTSVGVDGIDVRDGEHVLLGDTPEAFAECCLRLMNEPGLGERLSRDAHSVFMTAYSMEALARTMAALPADSSRPEC